MAEVTNPLDSICKVYLQTFGTNWSIPEENRYTLITKINVAATLLKNFKAS